MTPSEDKLIRYLDNVANAKDSDEMNRLLNQASESFNLPLETIYECFYQRIEDLCRNKLNEIADCKSLIQQAMKRKSLEDWLNRFLGGDRQRASNLLTRLESTIKKAPEIYSLQDLKELRKTVKIDYLVSEFIPRACYLLVVSKPKIGKTNVATSLSISVATGREWMGRKVVKSKVLFIQNEEPIETITIERFEHGLVDIELNEPELYEELIKSKQLIICRHYDLVADMDEILQIVQDEGIDLLIVDSLSKSISLKSGLSEYSPELFIKLNQWQEACHRLRFTSIILHHTTKVETTKDGKPNPDAIAGSNQLLRNNDGYWMLDKGKSDNELICHMVPRFSTEKSITFKRVEGEACYWTFEVVKESHLTPEELTLQNQILRLLHNRWSEWYNSSNNDRVYGLTLEEIMRSTSDTRTITISVLNRMLRTQGIGKYIKNKKFIYHYPSDGSSWLQVYLTQEDDNGLNKELNMRYKDMLLDATTTEDVNDLIDRWSLHQQIAIWQMLSYDEQQQVLLLRYPPRYKMGDVLEYNEQQVTIIKVVCDNTNKKHLYYYSDEDYLEMPYEM